MKQITAFYLLDDYYSEVDALWKVVVDDIRSVANQHREVIIGETLHSCLSSRVLQISENLHSNACGNPG